MFHYSCRKQMHVKLIRTSTFHNKHEVEVRLPVLSNKILAKDRFLSAEGRRKCFCGEIFGCLNYTKQGAQLPSFKFNVRCLSYWFIYIY